MNKLTDISKNGFRVCESREKNLILLLFHSGLRLKHIFLLIVISN